jgi:hypothetical protein
MQNTLPIRGIVMSQIMIPIRLAQELDLVAGDDTWRKIINIIENMFRLGQGFNLVAGDNTFRK